jgi:carbonic anhydrase
MNGLKKVLIFIGIVAIVYFVFYLAQNFWLPEGRVTNPGKAAELLEQGNGRYVAGKPLHPNQGAERRAATADRGQQPFATVLTCSDSRVPVEILFDCGVGDVFVVRVAGNVVNTDEAGSIEYGVDHLETPLLVVLGHTHCGAVTAVAGGGEIHGNIGALVKNIGTAVKTAKEAHPELSGSALVEEAVVANVWQSIDDLFRSSEVTRKRIKAAKLEVVGAVYDIESGKVSWLGSHPKQFELIKKYEGVILREEKKEGPSHS